MKFSTKCVAILYCITFSISSFAQTNNIPCPTTDAFCKGQATLASGDIYDGEFAFGVPNGKGLIKFANGDEYLGDFKNGKMHGQGSMVLSNGDAYSGEWKNGKAHGAGTYKKNSGSSFTGNFTDGMREGLGQIVWSTGDTIFGNWMEDKLYGTAHIKFTNGDHLKTNWKNGNMRVNVIYVSEEGKKIQGSMSTVYMVATMEEYFQEDIDELLTNLQVGWIFSAMEFKASQNFDLAVNFLNAAQNYGPTDSSQNTIIASQLEAIDKEKNNSGWARLPKK